MSNVVSVIAADRFAQGCRQARWQVRTGASVKEAAVAARETIADVPILVVTSSDFVVPEPLLVAMRSRAAAMLVVSEADLPMPLARIADDLDLDLAADLAAATMQADGSLAGVEGSSEDEIDALLASLSGGGSSPSASEPSLGGGWADDEDEADAQDRPIASSDQEVEHWSLADLEDEAAPVAPVDVAAAPDVQVAVSSAPAPDPSDDQAARIRELERQLAEARGSTSDDDDAFQVRDRSSEGVSRYGKPAEILVTIAGGGGVGKSSSSVALVQLAARQGLRVLAIDGTRGQPDMTSVVMRLADATKWHRTIAAAERSGDAHDAIVSAEEANQFRSQRAGNPGEPITFDSIFAPSASEHDATTIARFGPDLYTRVVAQLRNEYDLIVIDTQTLDNDSSDLHDQFLFPLIRSGAWVLAISDQTRVKQQHLSTQLQRMRGIGLPTARTLVMFTMMPAWEDDDQELVAQLYPQARLVGATLEDGDFRQAFSQWRIDTSITSVVTPMRRALATVFPQVAAFDPDNDPDETEARGLGVTLKRLFGGRR